MTHARHLQSGYSVHTKELRDEAGIWDQQSAELKDIVGKAEALRINRFEAGIFQVFIAAYGGAVHEVITRCDEGHARTAEIANSLREVAAAYEHAENEGQQLFTKRF